MPNENDSPALTPAQRRAIRDEFRRAEVENNRRLAERIASGKDVMRDRFDGVLEYARQLGAANLDVAGPRVVQIVEEVERLRTRLAAQQPVVDAAAVLASRWSRIWQPAPVNLDGLAAATERVVSAYEAMSVNGNGGGEHVREHADHGNAEAGAPADRPVGRCKVWLRLPDALGSAKCACGDPTHEVDHR